MFTTECRFLEKVANLEEFSEVALPRYPGDPRTEPSLCNANERLAFLMGGNDGFEDLDTCLSFDKVD